jgi:uncharacterized protein involved in exopolysaccharide biosynthesis
MFEGKMILLLIGFTAGIALSVVVALAMSIKEDLRRK